MFTCRLILLWCFGRCPDRREWSWSCFWEPLAWIRCRKPGIMNFPWWFVSEAFFFFQKKFSSFSLNEFRYFVKWLRNENWPRRRERPDVGSSLPVGWKLLSSPAVPSEWSHFWCANNTAHHYLSIVITVLILIRPTCYSPNNWTILTSNNKFFTNFDLKKPKFWNWKENCLNNKIKSLSIDQY